MRKWKKNRPPLVFSALYAACIEPVYNLSVYNIFFFLFYLIFNKGPVMSTEPTSPFFLRHTVFYLKRNLSWSSFLSLKVYLDRICLRCFVMVVFPLSLSLVTHLDTILHGGVTRPHPGPPTRPRLSSHPRAGLRLVGGGHSAGSYHVNNTNYINSWSTLSHLSGQ